MNSIFEKLKIYGFKKFVKYSIFEMRRKISSTFFGGSYSQQGEDLFMYNLLKKEKGFYVDVGANDSDRFSNTRLFYKQGWSGINVEPDAELFKKLSKKRTRDINLNIGIGKESSILTFYKIIPHTLSTFSKEDAEMSVRQGFRMVGTVDVPIERLEDVLDREAAGKEIDFISIDTEGLDMDVLRSNNWNRFRPHLICIESVVHTIDGRSNEKQDEHESYLTSLGYERIFNNGLNSIYEDKRYADEK